MRRRISASFAPLLLSLFVGAWPCLVCAQELPRWSEPVPLFEVNGPYYDKAPFLSFDGLTLYFAREHTPGSYSSRLFQAERALPCGPFGPAERIDALNSSSGHVASAWVSPDNLRMYYYDTGKAGQLRFSERNSTTETWSPGISVTELNRLGTIATSTFTEDERIVVFGGKGLAGGKGGWDLWMASRPDRESSFDDIVNLSAVNTEDWDLQPTLSGDGLTLYFMSERLGEAKIFRAHRASLEMPFGDVTHMTVFDTPGGTSLYPSISSDGGTFYFTHWPDGGDVDIYVSYALGIYHVDGTSGHDSADGLTPQTAIATIQRGIELARDGDTVSIGPGVYRESIDFLGKAITVQSSDDAAVLEAPGDFAVSFRTGEGPDSVLKNVVITNSYAGISIFGAAPTIVNVTVSGNRYGIEAYGSGSTYVSNSILWGNTRSDLYGCWAWHSCVEKWAFPGCCDPAMVPACEDPLFVDPDAGDYHLLSERGRYWPEHDVWVLDDVTSPCIDAGDPMADFSAERLPNGGRLNMGAYGGTAFASMSESPFKTDFNGDRTVDANDLEAFTDVWEEEMAENEPVIRR